MFKPEHRQIGYEPRTALLLQAAQVHATLAVAMALSTESNAVTKHMEKSRQYLALVEE